MVATVLERVIAKTTREGDCWLFTGCLSSGGYGQVRVGSRTDGSARTVSVHVVTYELLRGPVPEGLELDHLCRRKPCWRPEHLEAVTHEENMRRAEWLPTSLNAIKTECDHGHPFDEHNTRLYKGSRVCRTCDRAKSARYMQRKRLAVA